MERLSGRLLMSQITQEGLCELCCMQACQCRSNELLETNPGQSSAETPFLTRFDTVPF